MAVNVNTIVSLEQMQTKLECDRNSFQKQLRARCRAHRKNGSTYVYQLSWKLSLEKCVHLFVVIAVEKRKYLVD